MASSIQSFQQRLTENKLELVRTTPLILQINTGLLCNQSCRHCHLSAGPSKKELMSRETVDEIAAFAENNRFSTIDITGGAPEMNPDLPYMIERFSNLAPEVIVRSNLSALYGNQDLLKSFCDNRVTITASFPSVNEKQTDAQRGNGIFQKSIAMLGELNRLGYGREGTGLVLNLVSNPAGAFMPTGQAQAEKRFRKMLESKWGIRFSNLFSFANVPLGRFKSWLEESGNYTSYMNKLADCFNPEAVKGLMCRSLISVRWDGYLYDCDFNLAAGLDAGGKRIHITELEKAFQEGTGIATDSHCFACTAGAGFT